MECGDLLRWCLRLGGDSSIIGSVDCKININNLLFKNNYCREVHIFTKFIKGIVHIFRYRCMTF